MTIFGFGFHLELNCCYFLCVVEEGPMFLLLCYLCEAEVSQTKIEHSLLVSFLSFLILFLF